eukprot:gene15827-biopygen1597
MILSPSKHTASCARGGAKSETGRVVLRALEEATRVGWRHCSSGAAADRRSAFGTHWTAFQDPAPAPTAALESVGASAATRLDRTGPQSFGTHRRPAPAHVPPLRQADAAKPARATPIDQRSEAMQLRMESFTQTSELCLSVRSHV